MSAATAAVPESERLPCRWTWSELGWALAWSVALAVITAVPYVRAAAQAPAGEHYLGFVYNPDEPNVHLSWIRQASEGAVFFRNEFTSEPHIGRFFNLFMLTAGRLGGRLGWSPYRCWAAARVVAATLFGLVCYLALIAMTASRPLRRLGLALVTLSSGLGWYWVGGSYGGPGGQPSQNIAVDLLRTYVNPLAGVAVVILVLALWWAERAVLSDDTPAAWCAAFAGAMLTYLPAAGAGLLVAWTVGWLILHSVSEREWRWDRSYRAALIVLFASLPVYTAVRWVSLACVVVAVGVTAGLFWYREQLSAGSDEGDSEPLTGIGRYSVVAVVALGAVCHQVWLLVTEPVYPAVLLGLGVFAGILALLEHHTVARLRWPAAVLLYGLAWHATPALAIDPVDVEPNMVMPEAFGFLTIYLNPLFAVSMTLLVVALVLGRRGLRQPDWAAAAGAGVVGSLLANIHTYDAVPLLAVLTVYLGLLTWRDRAWRWERFGRYALILVLTLPAVAYQAWLINSEPLYAAKALTVTATPAWPTMLVSYGLLWPLGLLGALSLLRREGTRFWVVWAAVHFACVYLPPAYFPFQRKMIEGFHIVLAMLAAVGLAALARRLALGIAWLATWPRYRELGWVWSVRADLACRRGGWLRSLQLITALTLLPSTVVFVDSTLQNVAANNVAKRHVLMPPFSIPEADYRALVWMRDHVPSDAVVLCLPLVGSYIPGLAGRAVYVGHWAETIDYQTKLRQVGRFMKEPDPPAVKQGFLLRAGITHYYYGYYERIYTASRRPELADLEQIYPPGQEGADAPAVIYRVRQPGEPEPSDRGG